MGYFRAPFASSFAQGSLRLALTLDAGTGTDTTFIVVWIEPGAGPGESVVTIRSVKKGALQIKSLLTEDEFHFEFRKRLEEK